MATRRLEDKDRDIGPEINATAHELAFAGLTALAALVSRREIKPRELVELFIARIERLDPQLNAFRVVLLGHLGIKHLVVQVTAEAVYPGTAPTNPGAPPYTL